MKKQRIVWIIVLSTLLGGCYDFSNLENIRVEPVNPSFVVPVINSTISFKELVERSNANTVVGILPGTTMFYMAFRDTQQLFSAGDLFPIENLSFNESIAIPDDLVPPTFPAGTQIPTFNSSFSESITAVPGAELKEVQLSGGILRISIVNNFNHQVQGLIRINSLKNSSNVTYVFPFNLATVSSSTSDTRTLEGYVLSLYDTDADTYNTFGYEADVTITSSGHPSTSGSLDVSITLEEPQYELILGQFNASYQNDYLKYYISVFNASILADQYFADPTLNLTINNGFGIPLALDLPKFEFRNENTGTIIQIQNTATIENGLIIGGENVIDPITTPEEDFESSLFILSAQNSNIDQAFEVAPNVLSMATHFNLGDENSTSHDFFIKNTSQVDLISEIVLPLYGRITTHVLSDTLPNFEWPDIFGEDNATQESLKILFKFKFTNELPFDLALQAKFLDENGVAVDSLFSDDAEDWFIESAPVDEESGETIGATPKYSNIEITKARYEELSQSNSIVFYYRLHTGGEEGTSVKVLSTNKIGIQLSIYASLSIELDN